jgi:hypothetical protein
MPPKSKRGNSPTTPSHPTKKTKLRTSPEATPSTDKNDKGGNDEKKESGPQTAFIYLLAEAVFC